MRMRKGNKMGMTNFGWLKPSPFSEEAMIDRLVEEHNRNEHSYRISECPLCDDENMEFWQERGIGIQS